MKKKFLAAFLAALMLITFLASCNPNPPSDTDEGTGEATEAPTQQDSSSQTNGNGETGEPTEDINDPTVHDIVKDGVPQYAIVFPDGASERIKSAAKSIYDAVCKIATNKSDAEFGTDMSVEYLKTGKHDPAVKEILVGVTNYDQTSEVLSDLGYGDYAIKTVGNKIVITAWSESAIEMAVARFMLSFDSAKEGNNVSIKSQSINQKKAHVKLLNQIPAYDFEGTELSATYYSGDMCYLAIFNNATKLTHSEYLQKLENDGFVKYTENNMNDNLFTTYIKDTVVVNASYYPSKDEERVIVEELGKRSLPNLESENQYEKVCEPMFFQVGVSPDRSGKQNGMCYMFRLEDGSFIIFDGGHKGELDTENMPRQNSRRIYEIIKEYSPDPKNLVIKAWIITHGHDDHINAFRDFVSEYAKRVKIERFLSNFPSANQADNTETGTSAADDALAKLGEYSRNTKITKIHPGYKFYLAGAEIEFLYTLELYAPAMLTYYNTSSLVCSVTLGGQKFMMTGDMSDNANAIISNLYGEYIKSDIVQVAHHGFDGGSTNFYRTVDPKWAFWPINRSAYEYVKLSSRNEYMFQKGTNLKQTFVAFFQTTAVNLPFDGTNYTVTDNKFY